MWMAVSVWWVLERIFLFFLNLIFFFYFFHDNLILILKQEKIKTTPFSTYTFLNSPRKWQECCCFPALFPVQKHSCWWLSRRLQASAQDPRLTPCRALAFSGELACGRREDKVSVSFVLLCHARLPARSHGRRIYSPQGNHLLNLKSERRRGQRWWEAGLKFLIGKASRGYRENERENEMARGRKRERGRGCVFLK